MAATEISVDHIARRRGPRRHPPRYRGRPQVTTCEMAVVEPGAPVRIHGAGPLLRRGALHRLPRLRHLLVEPRRHRPARHRAQVFGVEVTDRTEALRELLLYGSYLQNHGTHLFVFAAPDFLGHKSGVPVGPRATRSCSSAHWG